MLKEQYSLTKLFRLYELGASTYYDSQQKVSAPEDKCKTLRTKITALFDESENSAGQRTLCTMLKNDGVYCTRYLARKIMREEHLQSRQLPKHSYPKGGKESLTSSNLLQRRFNVTAINRWWCGDVTYIWTQLGWCYLAVVMDLMSRRLVGHALSKIAESELTLIAFNRAFEARSKPQNLVFHSDQGCQYSSHIFRDTLKNNRVQQSMSRRGNCWDNAPMERFFRSFKTERMPRLGYETFEDAEADVSHYIDYYYNARRPHKHNNGLPPIAAEKRQAMINQP